MKKHLPLTLATALFGAAALNVSAQEASVADYRAMLGGESPGELWAEEGEALWKQKNGPKNVSLETCDLGKAGVLKGAYVELPRYFKDTDKVMDLEARLKHCMVTIQGQDPKAIDKAAFSSPGKYIESDMEKIVSYVAMQSNGLTFNIQTNHAKEKAAYEAGEALFWRRSGTMDFSCATCHAEDGKRIRLQTLYNAYNEKDSHATIGSWPTYRVSQSTVRTMQHRMWDCHWQMRLPDIDYASDAATALIMFMTKNANGGELNVPAIKR